MINKIKLKNFQSHIESEFNFTNGINVISGPSGVGKSSVIRALSYLFTNKKSPNVKYERRPDSNGFEIEVEVNGNTLKRVKSTKSNEYHINGEVYKDIGVSVPDRVYEVSNIKPIKVGNEEYNVQLSKQFDPHFLMFLSDSSKVKFLNRLSGSHILDIALKDTNKELLQVDKDLLSSSNELEVVQGKINNAIEIIDPIKEVVRDVKEQYSRLEEVVKRVEELKRAKNNLDSYRAQKKEFDDIHLILSKINIDGFDFKINRLNSLRELYKSKKSIENSLQAIETTISVMDGVDIDNINKSVERVDKLRKLFVDYCKVKEEIVSVGKQIEDTDLDIQGKITDVKEFLEKNPKCPTCNTNITKAKIDKIISELNK